MHELAITQSILEIALKAAGERNPSRIRVISLVMGPFRGWCQSVRPDVSGCAGKEGPGGGRPH